MYCLVGLKAGLLEFIWLFVFAPVTDGFSTVSKFESLGYFVSSFLVSGLALVVSASSTTSISLGFSSSYFCYSLFLSSSFDAG